MLHKIHSRGGDTRQILNNLREEDNLRREDNSAVPKVSSLRRFYCIQSPHAAGMQSGEPL